MSYERTTVMHDNIPIDRCRPVSGSPTLTNTTPVASVVRTAGDPKLAGTFPTELVFVGDRITGTGIATGARVVFVGKDFVLMDKAATSSGSGTVSFYSIGFVEAGWTVGLMLQGTGMAATARITAITETSLTMSANATASDITTITQRSHIPATVTVFTRPVPMAGAKLIAWVGTSADADVPGAPTYQYSADDGVTFRAADASFFGGVNHNWAVGFSTGGAIAVLGARLTATEDFKFFIGTHMRLTFAGHGTNQIDSVRIDAWVYRD